MSNEQNVLDFRDGKPLLPFQVRAILMAQYAASKENDHGCEMFLSYVEQRMLSAGAAFLLDFAKEMTKDFLRKKPQGTQS